MTEVDRLFAFARERHAIWERRAAGESPPWTDDPILRDFRFCNIYRELDRVTMWITHNWRAPHADDPDLWFAMAVARLLNQPPCLEELGYPVPWNRYHFLRTLKHRKDRGERVFNAAYIVSTNGIAEDKEVYVCDSVLTPLWKNRETLRPRQGDTLNSWHMHLMMYNGMGNFIAAQIVADMKYVQPLLQAPDWSTFAASGPGSRRGLNFVLGRDRKSPWVEDDWRMALTRLREELIPMFRSAGMPEPHAQDVQNLLCEYSKYHRARTEGKMPKQRFRGGKGE